MTWALTTEEVREMYILAADTNDADRDNGEDFDAWLAALRAEREAEQGEWEYGISSGCGSVNYVGSRESVDARIKSFEKAGAPLHDGERIVRRRKVGLWLPVEREGESNDRYRP